MSDTWILSQLARCVSWFSSRWLALQRKGQDVSYNRHLCCRRLFCRISNSFCGMWHACSASPCLCLFQVSQTGRTMRSWRRCWPSLNRSTWIASNTRVQPCTERESRHLTAADSRLTNNTHTQTPTTLTFDPLPPPTWTLHPFTSDLQEIDQGKK